MAVAIAPDSVLTIDKITEVLGDKADALLNFNSPKVSKDVLHLPGPDFVDRVWTASDRSPQVLRSLQQMFNTGRLAGTGYLSILPVDQGIEHAAGASFAKNPVYFDPENIVKLGIEGGCNAVASTFGVLGAVARKYAHKIPFMVKINHNELLTYPNKHDQILFGTIREAWNMGAVAVGATIYFGSEESARQIVEIAEQFQYAHELGMATVLWCYTRNNAFKVNGVNHETSADITGQANHLGVTLQADIVKQKLPTQTRGWHGLDQRTQGIPAPHPRRRGTLACHPRCVSVPRCDRGVRYIRVMPGAKPPGSNIAHLIRLQAFPRL
jgi:fructose-bisphosphate aldolase, class I